MGITPRIRPPADSGRRGAAAIRTDAVPREKPAAFFKLEGMCEKDVFQ